MPTRLPSTFIHRCVAAFSLAAAAGSLWASNPHVRVLLDVDDRLLAASRDGDTLACSAWGLNGGGGGGGGGPWLAPLTVWRRAGDGSAGAVLGHSQLAVTLPKAVSADGNVVGGLDDTNMLGAPRSAFVWRDLDGTPPATLLRLASPQGTQSADSVTWLNVNGTTGVGQSGGGYLTRWANLAAGDTPSAVYLHQDGSTGSTPGLGTMAITCISPLASDDANLIVGDDWDGAPFTWTAAHGRVALARENTWAFANVKALTPDGQRAVGMAYLGSNTESSSYLVAWTIDPGTQASTAQVLAGPFPPVPDLTIGSRTAPVAISTDRSIIVYNQPLGAGLGTAPMG